MSKRPAPLPSDPQYPYGSPEHSLTEEQLNERFPYAITLRFYDEAQKEAFIGGILDGWGENACDLVWSGWKGAAGVKTFYCTFVDGDDDSDE